MVQTWYIFHRYVKLPEYKQCPKPTRMIVRRCAGIDFQNPDIRISTSPETQKTYPLVN